MPRQFSISVKSGNKSVSMRFHQDSMFQTTMKFTTLTCEVFNGDHDNINIVDRHEVNLKLPLLLILTCQVCFVTCFKFFLKGNDKFPLKQKTGLKRFRHYQMEESDFIRDSKFFLITHDELDQLVYILAILLTIAPKIEYQLQINTLEQN